jgi:DNA invertase Pin-like site-specific DNA recombinase
MKRIESVCTYERRTGKPLAPLMAELYRLIIESGLTYDELEEKAGITKHAFGNWFCKGHQASLNAYACTVEALGYRMELTRC